MHACKRAPFHAMKHKPCKEFIDKYRVEQMHANSPIENHHVFSHACRGMDVNPGIDARGV